MAGLWLDDAEYAELLRELTRVLQPRLANPPRPGRKRRILGYVLLPGSDATSRPGTGPHPTLTTRPAREAMRRMLTHQTRTHSGGTHDADRGRHDRHDRPRPGAGGGFEEIHDLFAPPLRAMVPAEALQAAWAAEIAQRGPVTAVGEPVSEPAGPGGVLVRIPVSFERGEVTAVISVADGGWITGIQLAPASAAEPAGRGSRRITRTRRRSMSGT